MYFINVKFMYGLYIGDIIMLYIYKLQFKKTFNISYFFTIGSLTLLFIDSAK